MSAAEPPSPAVTLALLTEADEAEVLEFEVRNRAFFTRTIGDRGNAYFAEFSARHRALANENRSGTAMLFLVRDPTGRMVGRVNVRDIAGGCGELGYRIAEEAQGRGYATAAVAQVLERATSMGMQRLTATTTRANIASQRVLTANGFVAVTDGEPREVTVGGRLRPAVGFVRVLRPPG